MAKLNVWSTILLWQLLGSFGSTRGNPGGPPKSTGKVHNIQIAKVGQTRKLACPVEAEPPPIIQWLKDGEIIHQGWTRFRVSQDDGTLRIKTVEMDDAGRYICKATNGFGSISINYTVVIIDVETNTFKNDKGIFPQTPDEDLKKEDAEPQFAQPQKMKRDKIERPVGSSVRLKCRAVGNPRPHVEWQKDGETLDFMEDMLKGRHSWTLKLHDLQEDDSGKYTCVVSNRLGFINYTYTLEVIEKVKSKPVLLAPHPLNQTIAYGGSASFQCRVKSIVQPHIQWLKRVDDPSALPNPNATIDVKGQKFIVLKAGDVWNRPDGSYLNKLFITRASEADAGMYICLGANSMGYNFRSAYLVVNSGPKADHVSSESGTDSVPFVPLIIAVPACAIIFLILIVIVAIVILQRHGCCRRNVNNTSGVTLRSQRFNPVPTQEKDIYPAVQNPHMFQTSRELISKNPSCDFYSDISSVSQSHHQHAQMHNYGY